MDEGGFRGGWEGWGVRAAAGRRVAREGGADWAPVQAGGGDDEEAGEEGPAHAADQGLGSLLQAAVLP